jgi:hypothetical protein
MTYNWYEVISIDDLNAEGTESVELEFYTYELGIVTILVTKGNYTSILYDGVFLSLDMNGKNPFIFENKGIFLGSDNIIYFGIKVED